MVRVTVKPYLQDFVRQKGEEWGISDPTEIVNLLIFQSRENSPLPKNGNAPHKATSDRSELEELAGLLD
ncbi:hypothetical protein [Leptolyngbya ohadii]|uniref:hypothetical protein n=1 Tax=Leptolyngbya ohadii TaxID=1962290 RepID=UPI000B5A20F4|nr:hypothetical protein [Leptolyngbya ohadii]